MAADTLSLESETVPDEPLIQPVMRDGRRLGPGPALAAIRAHAARELGRLPEAQRQLEPGALYPVHVTPKLVALAAEVDAQIARQGETPA